MFSFMANTLGHFYKNFQGFTYCSVFKVRCCRFCDSQITISWRFAFVNNFFKSFFRISHAVSKDALCLIRLSLSLKDKAYLSTTFDKSQHLFVEIFPIVLTAYTICMKQRFIVQSAHRNWGCFTSNSKAALPVCIFNMLSFIHKCVQIICTVLQNI